VNIFSLPYIIHFFDSNSITAHIDSFDTKKKKTSNIEIKGNFLIEYAIKTSSNYSDKTFFLVPVVDSNWATSDNIDMVAKFEEAEINEMRNAFEENKADGILRNILWEKGLKSDEIKEFENLGIKINKTCLVLEVGKNNQINNQIYGLITINVIILAFLFSIIYKKIKII